MPDTRNRLSRLKDQKIKHRVQTIATKLRQRVMGFNANKSNWPNVRGPALVIIGVLGILGIWTAGNNYFQSPLSEATTAQESALSDDLALTIETRVELDDLLPYAFDFQLGVEVRRKVDVHTIIPDRPRLEIINYIVKKGDTLFGIAEKFGLNPETILWGNFDVLQDNPHSLRPDQNLNILPVNGTYYEWSAGDSMESVAGYFGVETQEIIDWPGNNIFPALGGDNQNIEPGTPIVIPGGRREFVTWSAPRITRANPAIASIAGPGACGSIYSGPIGEGYFIWPTTASFLSGSGYSDYHPGIDIAGGVGSAIYASASGVVVYAGWNNYGYGFMIVIDHGDGWQTLYAHMSAVNMVCGQAAFQGNVIGGVGSSGNSSGPHLHFEMQSDFYGRVNPFSFVSP